MKPYKINVRVQEMSAFFGDVDFSSIEIETDKNANSLVLEIINLIKKNIVKKGN